MYIATITLSSEGKTEQDALDNLAFSMDEMSGITGAEGSAHLAAYAKVYQRPDWEKIKNVEHLKWLASKDGGLDCYFLSHGGVKNGRHITYTKDTELFHIRNLIDDGEYLLNEKQIADPDYTNLGTAITKGTLIIE